MTTMIPQTLVRRIKTLKEPANYFVGTPGVEMSLPDNILVMGRYSERPASMQDKMHHRFLLAMNLGGQGDVIVDGQRHELAEGQCFVIFPHQWHYFFFDIKTIQWIFVTFELRSTGHLEPLRNHTVVLSDEAIRFLDLLTEFYVRVERFDSAGVRKIVLLTQLLLNEFVKSEYVISIPRSENLIDRINQFIIANLDRPLCVVDIAEHVSYSPSRLRVIYRKAMGISLGRYIKELKLHKAQRLLGTTDMSVNEIADQCGYDSVYSFSHAFKNYALISPMGFRKHVSTKK